MGQVTATTTKATMGEVSQALRAAWQQKFGALVEHDVLALLLGLVDLETRGGNAIHNWNLGNIVSTNDEQPWYQGADRTNTRHFRAFGSLVAGATALIGQLTSTTRAHWRNGLLSGDPHTFVASLAGKYGPPAYFEADPDKYLSAFLARWRRYAPEQPITVPPPQRATGASGGATIAIAIGLGLVAAVIVARVLR